MRWIAIIATLIFSCIAFSTFAKPTANAVAVSHQGIYLDGGFGIGTISCIDCSVDHHTVTHTHSAHIIDVGYQFNPYLAIELGTSVLQPFAYDSILTPGLMETPTSQEADIAIKAMLPIGKRFKLFGKVGDGVIWLPNRTDEKTAFSHKSTYLAAGVALHATHRVSAALSYNHYTADHLVIDSGMLSANILF